MLTPLQIEIADALLKHLIEFNGKSSLDEYPEYLRKRGFNWLDYNIVIQLLIKQLELIDYAGNDDYFINLTLEGNKAANIGMKKYLELREEDIQLDRQAKRASIKGVEKANKNSKLAMVIAIIIPIVLAVLQISIQYKNQINNAGNDRDGNSHIRTQDGHSDKPFNLTDSLFIEELKNSLKHDTVFLNDIGRLINNQKQD